MKISVVAALACLALMAPSVFAGESDAPLSTDEFRTHRAQIEAELAPGKTYAGLNSTKKKEVREVLSRMDATLAGHASSDDLEKKQRVRLFNDQERLNALLGTKTDDDRMICRREHKVGSNRPVTVCRTMAERKADAANSSDEMQRLQRTTNFPDPARR